MLDKNFIPRRFHESDSHWVRSFSLESIKCLIVCRGPVRKEAIERFDAIGVAEYGMLLSEKDSIVYPKCLAPELRDFKFAKNVHRVPDYMGSGQEEKAARIKEILEIAKKNGYSHIFAGYGFMAEDAEFIEAVEQAGILFMGPSSQVAKGAGAKDEAKKLARSLKVSVTPGVDNVTALALLTKVQDQAGLEGVARQHAIYFEYDGNKTLADNAETVLQAGYARHVELVTIGDLQSEAEVRCREIWIKHPDRRIRFKYIGGGGGKGQRIVTKPEQCAAAVMEVLAESKVVAPGSNRNFLIELNIENTRHNEIQLIGNGSWCLSLGGRDCSVQMHEQKLLEISLTKELLEKEIEECRHISPKRAQVLEADKNVLAEMESEAERFGEAVKLNSVSTFESIVDGRHHYFMEMNTRIQVEHRVTEMAYQLKFTNPHDKNEFFYVDSLVEAMALLSLHGRRLPRPERVLRYVAGGEVRINATNRSLQPHAGGIIYSWSDPLAEEIRDDQGIGTRNPDTGQFIFYNLAGAYDSNIALVITHGSGRRDNLERLNEILRRTELRGSDLQTNILVHYGLISWILGKDPMLKPSTQFMLPWLAAVGSLEAIVRDVDLQVAWNEAMARIPWGPGKEVLRRKETLLLRPIEKLFANPHVLAGFLGLGHGRLWKVEGDQVVLCENPVVFLQRLYHYLNLESRPGRPASEMIWDHDERILDSAVEFYAEIKQRSGISYNWEETSKLFLAHDNPSISKGDQGLWAACVAAHNGFQVGADLLLMIPRLAHQAGFLDIVVDDKLEPVFPAKYMDTSRRIELIKILSPPPKASSDEIVTPMGGHFFSREAPHLAPLIGEGDRFAPGQPLFIIEVMKMFNKVTATFSGRVVKHLLKDQDGKIVVKGQTIFKIEPDEMMSEESKEEIVARQRRVTLKVIG
jgi:acetyl/propionyl-CoA carboxylase alpha subunit